MIEYRLEDIHEVAQKLAKSFLPGEVIGFSGELAAGKTTLIKELLAVMGYQGNVSSPTFVIEHRYPVHFGEIREVIHLDFYRLAPDQLKHFDWQEYTDQSEKLIFIEWPEIAQCYLPSGAKRITIEKVNENTRRLHLLPDPGR